MKFVPISHGVFRHRVKLDRPLAFELPGSSPHRVPPPQLIRILLPVIAPPIAGESHVRHIPFFAKHKESTPNRRYRKP